MFELIQNQLNEVLPKQIKMNEKLKNEMRIQKMINHQNVVRSKNSFSDEFNYYIILDYCPGKSIRDYLRKSDHGRLNESEARRILKDVIHGVIYLHNRRIIHHDLKLENFIIGSDGRVKIADFGLATFCDDQPSQICGTPNYMSPEIILKNKKKVYDIEKGKHLPQVSTRL